MFFTTSRRSLALLTALGLFVFVLACGGGSAATSPTANSSAAAPVASDAPAATEAPAVPASYAVGETAELNGLKITVNEFKEVEGTQFMQPEEGKRFLVVDVTFENTGSDAATVSSIMNMELKDDTGQSYNIDLGATTASEGKSPDGTIVAGDKLRGQVGYQVPTDATGLQWIFKEAIGSNRVVFVVAP